MCDRQKLLVEQDQSVETAGVRVVVFGARRRVGGTLCIEPSWAMRSIET